MAKRVHQNIAASENTRTAARWRLFDETVQAIKAHNRHVPAKIIEQRIEQAVLETRAQSHRAVATKR